jgi:hypothetical protein
MTKKLLCQLAHNLTCRFDNVFTRQEEEAFNAAVGESGVVFHDSDGRGVLTLAAPCTIVVHRGYRWDGCSPKVNLLGLDLLWIGTPDGLIIGSERPEGGPDLIQDIPIAQERVTHLASAVHDVLGYCKRDPRMPELFRASGRDLWLSPGRRRRDWLFLELLRRRGHTLRHLYYSVTVLLGPLYDLVCGMSSTDGATTGA